MQVGYLTACMGKKTLEECVAFAGQAGFDALEVAKGHLPADRALAESAQIKDLFANQSLAVLATSMEGRPYTSLVAFVSSDDLARLYFTTGRSTRKYANISRENRISLLMDSRSNHSSDFREAIAVTALGTAKEVDKDRETELLALFLRRHPDLEEFVDCPNTALIQVEVATYLVVSRFQEVMELRMEK